MRVTGAALALIAATYGLVRLAFGLVLPDAQRDLGFDDALGGAISSGGSGLYVVAALVGFVAAARAPRAAVIAASASAALGAAGMAMAPDVVVFAAAAVLGSAGAGLASPAVVAVLKSHPATRGDARAQTIANSGTGPGLVLAGALALVLLPEWRVAWAIAAVCSALAGVAVVALSRGISTAGDRMPLPPRSWFARHVRPLTAALLFGAGSAAVWTFGRTQLVDAGLDETLSVVAWIGLGAGGASVALTARLLATWGPRRAWAITVVLAAGATVALPLTASGIVGAVVVAAVFGWAYTAATGALIAWTTDLDAERVAAGTALLFVTLVLGQGVGAAVLGLLVTGVGGWAAFAVGAGVCAAAAVFAGRRGARRPVAV
ncbi:Predicted arabinose efflux permease, MFS family [Microbacterium sp. ru370.1]|nr:Predicted arabinose efflux permease, MFS family [Microbacterium sp. ru370.1]SIT76773.1 Predicted arabinose efflux permease, MFS family [Microbacterium sp. RU1D]